MTDLSSPAPRRRSLWPFILIGLVLVLVLAGGLWWWFTRPIQPVVLSPQEKATVEAKIAAIQETDAAVSDVAVPASSAPNPPVVSEPSYQPGKREIVLTEREINGLLNENTDLGKSLSFQFGTDVVLARIETDLDPDLPFLGGRRFKARAKFIVSNKEGVSQFVIDDLTIWGISLPNDWLGGLKGRNLVGEILGEGKSDRLPGVESFAVQPGQLTIKLAE